MREELIADKYVEGSLTPEERAALKARLADDPVWTARFIGTLAETSAMIGAASQVEALAREADRQRVARQRRRWAVWTPLALAASLLAALGIGLWLNRARLEPLPGAAIARVESAQGSVFGFADAVATEPRPLRQGDEILPGMRIETGADSAATLAWLDKTAHLTLAESSVLSMPAGVPSVSLQKRMVLRQGALTATVASQPTASPFETETPHARATVLGTRFRLNVRGETGNAKQDARLPRRSAWAKPGRSTLDARLPAAGSEHPDPSINHQPSTIPATINHQPLTILHVDDGRVRFTRLADEAAIEVAAGQFAVAGASPDDFLLKAYPADTEWIDGRVIFEDRFENGLAHWEAGQFAVIDGQMQDYSSLKPEDGHRIEPRQIRRGSDTHRGIVLQRNATGNTKPFLLLKQKILSPAYAVEWELFHDAKRESGARNVLFGAQDSLTLFYHLRDSKPGTRTTLGVEVTPRDGDTRLPWKIRIKSNEALQSEALGRFQAGRVGFMAYMGPGEIFLIRCTIRELVPVPETPAQGE